MFSRFIQITLIAALLGLAGTVGARAKDDHLNPKVVELEQLLRSLDRYGIERRKVQVTEARKYFAFVQDGAAARFRLIPWLNHDYTPTFDPETVRATETGFALKLQRIAELIQELHAEGDSYLVESMEMEAADSQIELLEEENERLGQLRTQARTLARRLVNQLNQRRSVRLGLRKRIAVTDFPDLVEYGTDRLNEIEAKLVELRRRYAEAEIRRQDFTRSACHDALLPANLET